MPRQLPTSGNPEKQDGNTTGSKTDEKEEEAKKGQNESANSLHNAVELSSLKQIHREILDLLDTINKKTSSDQKDNIQKLKSRWLQHSQLEEEFLLPELDKRNMESADLLEGEVKRDLVKLLLVNLQVNKTGGAEDAAKLRVLDAFIRQLVEAEEKPNIGLFARIESFNLPDIDKKVSNRKNELKQEGMSTPVLRHLSIDDFIQDSNEQEAIVTNRERDSQGRFVSDDDRRYGNQSRRRDDDDRGYRDNRRYGRAEDDDRRGNEGRYSSSRDDDDRRSRSYSRSSDDDDRRYGRRGDEGSGRDRGQGGWFGDSEGHAEAARRGWDDRRSSDDDDRRGRSYSRSRDDDDRRYGRRDDDGYSRDRGQGGWFGDSEGHAEAARRGWDDRRSSDDDDRRGRSYSRSRDDDDRRYSRRDDDNYGRDHGQGGWFGDSAGHAEAARKGWRQRDNY